MLNHLQNPQVAPSRVVILGSAGFVASSVKRHLDKSGIPVLELPRTKLDLTHPESGNLLAGLLLASDSL